VEAAEAAAKHINDHSTTEALLWSASGKSGS
jgi:hypothetical protein